MRLLISDEGVRLSKVGTKNLPKQDLVEIFIDITRDIKIFPGGKLSRRTLNERYRGSF